MPMLSIIALAQAQAPAPRLLPNLIMIGAFIAIFWFLLIRPQRKLRQQHEQLVSGLKKGDEVMTEGGIIGNVVHLAEDRLTVRTAENTRIVVARNKIARVFPSESGETKS
jgi:preprotein translocase subunit YajC